MNIKIRVPLQFEIPQNVLDKLTDDPSRANYLEGQDELNELIKSQLTDQTNDRQLIDTCAEIIEDHYTEKNVDRLNNFANDLRMQIIDKIQEEVTATIDDCFENLDENADITKTIYNETDNLIKELN